jgi:hypothetical protein
MATRISDVEDGDMLTCTTRPSDQRRQPPMVPTMGYRPYWATRVSDEPSEALQKADDQAASTALSLWLLITGGALP